MNQITGIELMREFKTVAKARNHKNWSLSYKTPITHTTMKERFLDSTKAQGSKKDASDREFCPVLGENQFSPKLVHNSMQISLDLF